MKKDSTRSDLNQVLAQGSLTFHFASRLFDPAIQTKVELLYHYLRVSDDWFDERKPEPQDFVFWKDLTLAALRNEANKTPQTAFDCFGSLHRLQRLLGSPLPEPWFEDFLTGMQLDFDHKPLENEEQLKSYAYHVAGVIGLMMAHIMQATSAKALQSAVWLGMAMQLTNIARDVLKDYQNNRIYLPQTWLQDEGFKDMADFMGAHRANPKDIRIFRVIERLLNLADQYYEVAQEGYHELNFRCRLVIQIAQLLYQAIGHKIKRQRILKFRVSTHYWEKCFYFLKGWFLCLYKRPPPLKMQSPLYSPYSPLATPLKLDPY
jgi:phytoene synthase